MNTLFCGMLAVAGCVLLAGASVAETSEVRGHEKKSDATPVSLHVRTSPNPSKVDKWPMMRHANPNAGKEETKDLLKAKRPK